MAPPRELLSGFGSSKGGGFGGGFGGGGGASLGGNVQVEPPNQPSGGGNPGMF